MEHFWKSRGFLGPQQGQILLIMVLTLVVVLTVGLSVASRSITNVKISKQNEESARAFQAAEAGVQQALQSYSGGDVNLPQSSLANESSFKTTLNVVDGTQFLVRGGSSVEQSVGADVQLSSGSTFNGNVVVYFSQNTQNICSGSDKTKIQPAIEVIVVQNASNPIQKFVFDPCTISSNRTPGASPTSNGGTITDTDLGTSTTFNYSATIGPITNGSVMKVIPIYNSTKVGITSSIALPTQGKLVKSTGTSGDTVRTVQYFESLPEIPTEILQYAILSQ